MLIKNFDEGIIKWLLKKGLKEVDVNNRLALQVCIPGTRAEFKNRFFPCEMGLDESMPAPIRFEFAQLITQRMVVCGFVPDGTTQGEMETFYNLSVRMRNRALNLDVDGRTVYMYLTRRLTKKEITPEIARWVLPYMRLRKS